MKDDERRAKGFWMASLGCLGFIERLRWDCGMGFLLDGVEVGWGWG